MLNRIPIQSIKTLKISPIPILFKKIGQWVIIFRYAFTFIATTSVAVYILTLFPAQTTVFNPSITSRYQFFNLEVPKDANFAGELIPVDDYQVYTRFRHELRLNVIYQRNSQLLIKRSGRWFPIIEPILKQHGIPKDFLYVMAVESMFENKISPRGAAGFWQLMPAPAIKFGLVINNEIDERFHPIKSTIAACKLIKLLKKELSSWSSVLAAYNMGLGAYSKKLKNQGSKNYYDLSFSKETSRYVFRIAALKEVLERGYRYGITVPKKYRFTPIPIRTIKIKNSIPNLGTWAKEQKVNEEIIHMQNPWIIGHSLTIRPSSSFSIDIPKNLKIYQNLASLEALEFQSDSIPVVDSISIEELPKTRLMPIATQSTDKALKEDPENPETEIQAFSTETYHEVAAGENLGSIAIKYNTTTKDLLILNNLKKKSLLRIGQKLRVR
jgi:hypothetical protein